MVLSIEPFSQTPPSVLGGSIDPPLPPPVESPTAPAAAPDATQGQTHGNRPPGPRQTCRRPQSCSTRGTCHPASRGTRPAPHPGPCAGPGASGAGTSSRVRDWGCAAEGCASCRGWGRGQRARGAPSNGNMPERGLRFAGVRAPVKGLTPEFYVSGGGGGGCGGDPPPQETLSC